MKKFLAIVFSLIFALSACTVAFAATETCTTCKQKFETVEAYNEHLKDCKPITYKYNCEFCNAGFDTAEAFNNHLGGKAETADNCDVRYRSCKYGCGNSFDTVAELTDHQDICPKYSETCKYCGETSTSKADNDKHLKDCTLKNVSGDNEAVAGILNKAIDALKNVDWKALADKVVDLVKGIDFEGLIAKIKPLVEKVVTLVKGFAA